MRRTKKVLLWASATVVTLLIGIFATRVAKDYVISYRLRHFREAIAHQDLSGALHQVVQMATTRHYETNAVSLGRTFWIAANRLPDVEVLHDVEPRNEQTDAVLVCSLKIAGSDIADSTEPLRAHRLLQLSRQLLEGTVARQKAHVLVAELALIKDPEAASDLLLPVSAFDKRIQKITPSSVLGMSLYLNRQYEDIVELRKERMPNPCPPLSIHDETLLAVEVLATSETMGLEKAASLAEKYLSERLFSREIHISRMQTVAAGKALSQ